MGEPAIEFDNRGEVGVLNIAVGDAAARHHTHLASGRRQPVPALDLVEVAPFERREGSVGGVVDNGKQGLTVPKPPPRQQG